MNSELREDKGTWLLLVDGCHKVVYWAMLTFNLGLVLIRFAIRSSRTPKVTAITIFSHEFFLPLRLSDVFVAIAWLSFAFEAVGVTVLHAGKLFIIPADLDEPITVQYLSTYTLKWEYATGIVYPDCMYAVKAACLCAYAEFAPRTTYVRWGLWFLSLFTGVSFVVQGLLATLWCRPVSSNWTHDMDKFCNINTSANIWYQYLVPHIGTDLFIYLFPIPIIAPLFIKSKHRSPSGTVLSTVQKVGLAISFLAGFFSIFMAILGVFVLMGRHTAYGGHQKEVAFAICALEQTWAIVVVCSPALVSLMVRTYSGSKRRLRRRAGGREAAVVEMFPADSTADRTKTDLESGKPYRASDDVGAGLVTLKSSDYQHIQRTPLSREAAAQTSTC